MMNYKKIEDLDLSTSNIVMGTGFNHMMRGSRKEAFKMLDYAFECGINIFDTAHIYGEAEVLLGEWINKRKIRDKVIILSKGANPTKENPHRCNKESLKEDIEESFRRLKTDYIDIYLLHRDDESVSPESVLEGLNEYYDSGKIKIFGGSNWSVNRLEEVNNLAKKEGIKGFSVSSPCFSLAEQIGDPWGGSVNISGDSHKSDRKWYEENQIPVISYSALARGFLSGKYKTGMNIHGSDLQNGTIEEYNYPENILRLKRCENLAKEKNTAVSVIALSYILGQDMNVFPIISPSEKEHLKINLMALDIKLSKEEIIYLECGN